MNNHKDPLSFLTHLHSGFGQSYPHRDLLAHEDVRVVGLREAPLQFVQLGRSESRSVSLLLAGLFRVLEGTVEGRC